MNDTRLNKDSRYGGTGQDVNSTTNRRVVWGSIGVTIIILIAMVWITVYVRSSRHYHEGERFLKEGKLIEAITSYESSAHAYTPGNSYVARSLDRLWEIGERLETQYSDPVYPLLAYRSLRSSVYAIRSYYMPHKEWIPRCDEKIGALVAIQIEKQQQAVAAKTEQQAEMTHREGPDQADESDRGDESRLHADEETPQMEKKQQ
ncbi:hypothetical protein JXA80_02625 [bacterium]|nr:hypothetical protein [candidate division CSSED10-310 bacterium]